MKNVESNPEEALVGFVHVTSEGLHDTIVMEMIEKGDNSIYLDISKRNHIDLFTATGVERFIEKFRLTGNIDIVTQMANSCLSNLMLGEIDQRILSSYVKLGLCMLTTNDIDPKEGLFKPGDETIEVYKLEKTTLQSFIFYLLIFTVRHITLTNHKTITQGRDRITRQN